MDTGIYRYKQKLKVNMPPKNNVTNMYPWQHLCHPLPIQINKILKTCSSERPTRESLGSTTIFNIHMNNQV